MQLVNWCLVSTSCINTQGSQGCNEGVLAVQGTTKPKTKGWKMNLKNKPSCASDSSDAAVYSSLCFLVELWDLWLEIIMVCGDMLGILSYFYWG